MKSKYFLLIFISKALAYKNTYQKAMAVPTNGPTPTINTAIPDLDEAVNYYDCIPLEGTRTCEGMDNFYVPDTGVYISTVDKFDAYVNAEVNNDSGILLALCPNANIKHDLQKVAFRYSMYCGRVLYSQARWCPQNSDQIRANPQLSLCKSTCLGYAQSIADYGQTVCGNTDNSIGEKIKENIINKWCNIFSDEPGCIEGTTKEAKQCGYRSASYAVEAEKFNPNNKCWKTESDQSSKIEQLREIASKEESDAEMGKIKWKVVYPISSIVIVSGLTAFFWVKQNKQYKLGYIPGTAKKMNDYEFVPSNAKPSREYVDDDFIDKFELEIPKTTLTRSGSLSVKKLSRAEGVQNDKKYMIAIYNYHPQKEDELELHSGDRVRIEHEYEDG
ncbi:hypothetical protein PIROE2DRAFT_7218 [Piromyces sp. E2]|nr:hypothetical protein PIROE2DRAFT_7218 [Piromyces sp. E2]|eukprot:OUM65718.1 hypothetical protein PIROE2DRAFT_7218 [Piromyces sp. E2]